MTEERFFERHDDMKRQEREDRPCGHREDRPCGHRRMWDEGRPGQPEGRRFPHFPDPDSLMGLWIRSHQAMERQPADHRGVRRILRMLDLAGGSLSQRELCQLMDVRPGSLSELLGKMEQRGLITRERLEDDHRRVTVALTEDGQKKAKERGRRDIFAALNDEEKEQLKGLLAKLLCSWEEPSADGKEAPEKKNNPEN